MSSPSLDHIETHNFKSPATTSATTTTKTQTNSAKRSTTSPTWFDSINRVIVNRSPFLTILFSRHQQFQHNISKNR